MTAILPTEKIAKINSEIRDKYLGSMSSFVGIDASNDLKKSIDQDPDLAHLYLRGLITIVCESEYYMPRIEVV